MHIDPCDIVRNEKIIRRCVEMMSLSLKDGNERGIVVFETDDGISMTGIQKGSSHSITLSVPSKLGLGLIEKVGVLGAIHTHPNEAYDTLFSERDIRNTINGEYHFSAAVFDKGESGNVLIDVFSDKGFSSMEELEDDLGIESGSFDFILKANDVLFECTIDAGRCKTCP